MKKSFLTSIICLIFSSLFAGKNENAPSVNIPLALEENLGQIASADGSMVLFRATAPGLHFFVRPDGISWQFSKMEFQNSGFKKQPEVKSHETYRMDVQFIGMQYPSKITKEGRSAYYKNYIAEDIMNVFDYERVTLHNVYPGIDWIIYSKNNSLKYDFVIQPGADPSLIKFNTRWNDKLTLNSDGGYTISCPMGKIDELSPVSFQNNLSIKTKIVRNGSYYQFQTATYNPNQQLTIDPPLMWSYNTNLTVNPYHLDPLSMDVAIDGSVLVGGLTDGAGSLAGGGFQSTPGGNLDGFIASFSPSGNLNWLSYYGGSNYDVINGIACSSDGSFAVCGYTSSLTGIASGGFLNSISGSISGSGFLAKFNASGARLWGTYVQFADRSNIESCTFDNNGNIWAVGNTEGDALTAGGFQENNGGGGDGLILKVNPNGSLLWSSLLGGTNNDLLIDCDIDASGNLVAVGQTLSSTNINYSGFQPTYSGSYDGMITKISNTGTMIWSSYLGGTTYDILNGVRFLSSGDLIISGATSSPSLATSGASQTTHGGGVSDFILGRVTAAGTLSWLTYLGGSSEESSSKIDIAPNNNILVTGSTSSTNFPVLNASQNSYGGSRDGFFAMFSETGTKIFATYYGGSNYDLATACAVNDNNELFIAGQFVNSFFGVASTALGFPITNMYVNKYCGLSVTPTIQISSDKIQYCSDELISLQSTITNGGTNPEYIWYINGMPFTELGNNSSPSFSINLSTQTTYNLSCNLISSDPCADPMEVTSNTVSILVLAEVPKPIITVNGNVLQSSAAEHYQWFLNGNPVGVDDQFHTATESGVYTVIMSVDDCWSQMSDPVSITGTSELQELGISLFPNPVTQGQITVTSPIDGSLKIFEMSGKLLHQIGLIRGEQKIDIGNLPPAIYMVSISNHYQKMVVSGK